MMKAIDVMCAGECGRVLASTVPNQGQDPARRARVFFCPACSATLKREVRKEIVDPIQAKLEAILKRVEGAEVVPADVVIDLVQIISDMRKATRLG